ncbi:acetyl-CoA synthetase-like protein [Laetiporus sulphureus 93-53]|uniref:Acetyl-CoA synthetase-like protein n=1 Tax=Laetiporus sulphureus 93-53 TaxID=1314785 RepID=A0A165EHY1_9APHY|nr:acetyl-CoA synthetase-like protein [Laetiporus sulphureus 93-53]KZT07086.1 acetyl-CoA synthetase-like protein [Laetiporus sulphureus 93-53]
MSSFKTHLTVLAESAATYPTRPVFRIPIVDTQSRRVRDWNTITYSQFQSDVELYARYWSRALRADGLPRRSVVGLWLGGLAYTDAVHIYSIARAGYIPQLFSLKLPNPDVIYELLHKANAKSLIYDSSYVPDLVNCPVTTHAVVHVRPQDLQDAPLPSMPDLTTVKGTDTVMIFHTSGSTSGSPKLIRCSYSWLNTIIAKAGRVSKSIRQTEQDVTVIMGSMCHIGQTFMLLGSLQNGACTIQPTEISFSSEELLDMIVRCRLNRINQFPAYLGIHLRNSRHNPKLLAQLRALDEILYSGGQMPREDEEWAYSNDLKLLNAFGSTECGLMLLSMRGGGRPSPSLRPIMEGVKYGFFPISSQDEGAYANLNNQLVELVILAESPDCPDPSLRSADGHYHTGDLFIEVSPGAYVSRGRNDDWIKTAVALRCDTKSIEDNVISTCGELVANCIVVGNGRPSPALFVEAAVAMDEERLKKEIIRRTRHFHSRRYIHERITSTKMVIVVPRNILPRTATKGNIRRRAVEEMFKAELDAMFSS